MPLSRSLLARLSVLLLVPLLVSFGYQAYKASFPDNDSTMSEIKNVAVIGVCPCPCLTLQQYVNKS
jgi:hypothetical protein